MQIVELEVLYPIYGKNAKPNIPVRSIEQSKTPLRQSSKHLYDNMQQYPLNFYDLVACLNFVHHSSFEVQQ